MSTDAPRPLNDPTPSTARIAIIAARFNENLVDALLTGCQMRLEHAKMRGRVNLFRVPGAFELPVAALAAAQSGYDAVICLGCVIRGDTPHFEYVAGESARGIAHVAVATGKPVIFGVLTTNTEAQAWDRVGGTHGHAGERAADAALEMLATLAAIRAS